MASASSLGLKFETAYTATLDNTSDTSVETYIERRYYQKK
jgi:hypothetical protein